VALAYGLPSLCARLRHIIADTRSCFLPPDPPGPGALATSHPCILRPCALNPPSQAATQWSPWLAASTGPHFLLGCVIAPTGYF
jgi:hypothetical protein